MRTSLFTSIAAAATLLSAVSFADDRNFTLVNGTGYDIKFLGVNAPNDNNFNETS